MSEVNLLKCTCKDGIICLLIKARRRSPTLVSVCLEKIWHRFFFQSFGDCSTF